MIFLPLPIVVSLMLMTILLMQRERLIDTLSGRIFTALLLLYCLNLLLVGMRWGYDITIFLPLQALLTVVWCILAWVAFRSLSREGAIWRWRDDWIHGGAIITLIIAIAFWPDPIDIILMITYAIYGGLLIRLALKGSDALHMVCLSTAQLCHRALWVTGYLLIVFVFVDVLISLDIHMNQGKYSPTIIAIANLPSMIALGLAALIAGKARSIATIELESTKTKSFNIDHQEAQQLMSKLRTLLIDQALYKEPELNLQRLARKCGIPARRVSRAVNMVTEQNVSQWVNEHRIKTACGLLKNSNDNVTHVMESVGFMTKSNFNREFKRVTGTSPSGWRKQNGSTPL